MVGSVVISKTSCFSTASVCCLLFWLNCRMHWLWGTVLPSFHFNETQLIFPPVSIGHKAASNTSIILSIILSESTSISFNWEGDEGRLDHQHMQAHTPSSLAFWPDKEQHRLCWTSLGAEQNKPVSSICFISLMPYFHSAMAAGRLFLDVKRFCEWQLWETQVVIKKLIGDVNVPTAPLRGGVRLFSKADFCNASSFANLHLCHITSLSKAQYQNQTAV